MVPRGSRGLVSLANLVTNLLKDLETTYLTTDVEKKSYIEQRRDKKFVDRIEHTLEQIHLGGKLDQMVLLESKPKNASRSSKMMNTSEIPQVVMNTGQAPEVSVTENS
jgi:hypothetical protein